MTPLSEQRPRQETEPEEVFRALEDVLSRREFDDGESMLDELWRWISDRFEPGGQVVIGDYLFAGILTVILVAIVYVAIRLLVAGARRVPTDDDEGGAAGGPTVEERVRALLAQAREARAQGDARLALRTLFFALFLGLGERGDLSYHEAWTNRELLRRGKPSPRARELLTPLVDELEPKEFGRQGVTEADLDRLETLCARVLGRDRGAAA